LGSPPGELNTSSKGSELLNPSKIALSDFGIAPITIYINSVIEKAAVIEPCSILVGWSYLYPGIENAK
jgi:hypothetical protein